MRRSRGRAAFDAPHFTARKWVRSQNQNNTAPAPTNGHKRRRERAIIRPDLTRLSLLWLCGACLRLTVLATPPVVPLLHADLHLSETAIGWLSSLPPMLFAIMAVPGALLIARFGILPALVMGLLINAFGSAARGIYPDAISLYVSTMIMAAGVAIMQPSLPPLVRTWFPQRIGFATAVYTNGLLVGETLAVALTIPLVLPLVNDSWRLSFVAWSAPVLLTALLVIACVSTLGGTSQAAISTNRKWWPDWRQPLIWRLGLILGSINAMYFVTNAFLPDYVVAAGRPDLIGKSLTALNFCQLPASFVMLGLAGRLVKEPWAYRVTGGVAALCIVGMMTMTGYWIVVLVGSARLHHRGDAHSHARAAVGARRARRRPPHLGRHVHDQLQRRDGALGGRRLAVGFDRPAGRRPRACRSLRTCDRGLGRNSAPFQFVVCCRLVSDRQCAVGARIGGAHDALRRDHDRIGRCERPLQNDLVAISPQRVDKRGRK